MMWPRKTLRPILQAEVAECGIACLAMIAQWHGNDIGLRNLRRRFPSGGQAVSLKKLSDCASQLGFATRGVRVELDDLALLPTPCILHWGMSHYVVLQRVRRNAAGRLKSVLIVDPARGALDLGRETVSTKFTGVVLELTPSAAFRSTQKKEPRASLRTMSKGVDGLGRALTYVLLLAVAIEAMATAAPLFLQWVVDAALVAVDLDLLYVLAGGFAVLTVAQAAITLIRSRIVLHASTRINIHWSASVFAHLLHLPLSYFQQRHVGDIVSRFGSITTIQRVLSQSFVETIIDGVMAVVSLAALVLYSPVLAVVVVAAVVLYALIRVAVYAGMRNTTIEMLGAQALEQSLFLETTQSMQAIKLFGREAQRQHRWSGAMIDAKVRDAQVQATGLNVAAAFQVLFGVENIIAITIAGVAVLHQTLTVGMIYALLAYKATFTGRAHSLIDKFMDLRMLSVHLERLGDVVLEDKEHGADHPSGDERASDDSGTLGFSSIEFRGVWFRYSEVDPWVLEDISFVVRPGESVCLVGPSGRGKTTILRLLLGTVEPTRGEVLINGSPIKAYGITRYRRLFASVMQDDHLLSGCIEDNICFFDSEPDVGRVADSAKVACIHDDISRLPLGYATPVGDLVGCTLSGGQRQRILLARAIYRRPNILVLDEATSHLDTLTEARVNSNIAALGLTKIVVSHRPETIRNIDRTIHLNALPHQCDKADEKVA